MDNVSDTRKPSGALLTSSICKNLRPINTKFYYSLSVSIALAFTLLQFHLISHVVDSYPSAASKQDQTPRSHSQQHPAGGLRRTVSESLMDRIDVDAYLKNQKALKLQIQCIVHDGPCDFVGRWLKPRIRMALLGECHHCSEKAKSQIAKIVDHIQSTYPDEFKAGVAKYLLQAGLDVAVDGKVDADETETLALLSPSTSDSTIIVEIVDSRDESAPPIAA